jgi:hypothetical protein
MSVKFSDFVRSVRIDFKNYELKESYFDFLSDIHDIQHTYRVMMNVLRLGCLLNDPESTRLAFAAAFIHDMARKNDEPEPMHGMRAANNKAYLLKEWQSKKINEAEQKKLVSELKQIKTAVCDHCNKDKPLSGDRVAIILRDADLLDRFRINPKEHFNFMTKEARSMQEFSRGLLNYKLSIDVFKNLLTIKT